MNVPITGATAWCDPTANFTYRIQEPQSNNLLAVFSNGSIGIFGSWGPTPQRREVNRAKPPEKILHLRLLGARTVVLAPDAPELSLLHEPWASTGFVLAPLVIGYTKVWFRPYAKYRSQYLSSNPGETKLSTGWRPT